MITLSSINFRICELLSKNIKNFVKIYTQYKSNNKYWQVGENSYQFRGDS